MYFRADHLVTSFGFGIVIGLIIAYLVQRELNSTKFQNDISTEQYHSLQQTNETVKQFRTQNFTTISTPSEQGTDK